jgi:hypothetical protein
MLGVKFQDLILGCWLTSIEIKSFDIVYSLHIVVLCYDRATYTYKYNLDFETLFKDEQFNIFD